MTQQVVAPNYELGETPQEVKKRKAAKRRRKKIIKNIFTLLILAGVAAAGYFGFQKLFSEEEGEMQALTDFAYRGSITTRVTGGGVTTPITSEPVIADFKSKIDTVFVMAGMPVMIGDPLYSINTEEVGKDLEAAQKTLEELEASYVDAMKLPESLREQIIAEENKIAALSVYAPFDGKIINTAATIGSTVSEGGTICQLVNDSKMLLTLYFSYAYANDIKVGDKAVISIPSTMSNVEGKVREIAMVERISPEGTKLFEIVFEMQNGGTLTEGVAAVASVELADGIKATPYEAGELKYYEVKNIKTEAGGEVIDSKLRNYAVVKKGDKLITMKNDTYDERISSIEKSIEEAEKSASAITDKIAAQQEVIAQLEDKMANNMIFSEVNGMVSSVMIIANQTIEAGTQVMTISDSSVMTIEARIDSLNISDVKVGAEVMLTQYGMDYNSTHIGTIADISLEGRYENNYSYFPATIMVDNPEGTILSGTYIQYEIIANEALDCIIAPAQCVKNTDAGTVVFVKADIAPENTVELGEGVTVPEGFFAVPVTTGLSDNYSVEIVEGIDEGAELFLQFMTDQGSSWENGGIIW